MSPSLSLLVWLDQHPLVYLEAVGSLLIVALAITVAPLFQGKPDAIRRHDWSWSLPIFAILFAGRWPALIFPRELNVDESQLMAGAHALAHDPAFWRSVTGGTAGPLDFFALWPAGWVCGWDTFFTARLTATLLIGVSLVLAHQCLALLAGRTVARVAVMAVLAVEALTHSADFLHYSTELLPMVLISGAGYAAVRRWLGAGGSFWCGLGGLLLGAVPFAKLQAVPLALVMGLAWLGAELRAPASARHRAFLIAGALLPAMVFACQLTITGEWQSFVQSYLVFNFQYAGTGRGSVRESLVLMLQHAWKWDNLLLLALIGVAVWLALMVRLRASADRGLRLLTWSALAGWWLALFCIIVPERPYVHYWQLLILPGQLLLGGMMARMLSTAPEPERRREQWVAAGAAIIFTGLLLIHRGRYPNLFVGELAYFQQNSRSELARHVTAHAQPGEAIAIWGRADSLYVETGLRQAARDSHTGGLIEPSPLRDYFRARYLRDFEARKPALFLDVVGASGMQYKTAEFRHERIFPALAEALRTNYVLVEEFNEARIYRRKDLAAR